MRKVWIGGGASVAVGSLIAAILLMSNPVPVVLTVPAITGGAVKGGTVTCTDGTWQNDPHTFARVWKRDAITIPGETGTTLNLAGGDVGHSITCTVTATNDNGESLPATSAAVTVENAGLANIWVAQSPGGGCSRSDTQIELNTAHDCSLTQATALAVDGDVLRLQAGDYGLWDGTDQAITLKPAPGQHSTMGLFLRAPFGDPALADCCFTIDGGPDFDIEINKNGGPSFGGGVHDITITNVEFTMRVAFDDPGPDANIVLDHNWHHNVGPNFNPAGSLTFSYSNHDCGCIVENSLFEDFSADGLQLGSGVTVRNNLFKDIVPADPEEHTDAIQTVGGSNDVFTGNLVTGDNVSVNDCEQTISLTDGGANVRIEHNVIACGSANGIIMGAHVEYGEARLQNITVRHNTVDPLVMGAKSSLLCAYGDHLDWRNNLTHNQSVTDCTFDYRANNMVMAGASSPFTFTGTPVFAGGSPRRTFEDYCLDPSSPGYTGASDGGQVGACGGDYATGNYGPPADWYTFEGRP